MNRPRKVAIGALAGALLTLAIHPASRPFILTPFADLGGSVELHTTPLVPRNIFVLPAPRDTLSASLWAQAGAEQLQLEKPLPKKTLAQLIDICRAAAKGEPENAYWRQMEAVFLCQAGEIQSAEAAWRQASVAGQWDDYQSRRLQRLSRELSSKDGARMAWHASAAYFERSSASARAIETSSKILFKSALGNQGRMLEWRLATLRNGELLRKFSRSIEVGIYGAALVDSASLPPGAISITKPRERLLFRSELVDTLRLAGKSREALEADEVFRSNDAWLALAEPKHAADNVRQQSEIAAYTASIPGTLIGIALIGLVLRGIVWGFEAWPKSQRLLQPPLAPAFGVAAGIALYLQTGLVLAAIAVAMCFGFLAFEPDRIRKRMPERMGLAFRATVAALATLFAFLLGVFWTGITAPALELGPRLAWPADLYGGKTITLSLAVLVLSLLLLAAPGWAMVERIPTPFATVFTLREFALKLIWGGLVAGVILTPMAIYVDSQVRDTMQRLLANEPAEYLLREQ